MIAVVGGDEQVAALAEIRRVLGTIIRMCGGIFNSYASFLREPE
jgi:hypothetical protein